MTVVLIGEKLLSEGKYEIPEAVSISLSDCSPSYLLLHVARRNSTESKESSMVKDLGESGRYEGP